MAASSFGLMSCSSSAGPRNWLWSGINRTELQSKDFVTWLFGAMVEDSLLARTHWLSCTGTQSCAGVGVVMSAC